MQTRRLFALVAVWMVATLALAQQPKRLDLPPDDDVWGYGWIGGPYPVGGPSPLPPAIVPERWIVLPQSAGDGLAALAAHLCASTVPAPSANEADAMPDDVRSRWELRAGQPVTGASCAYTQVVSETEEVRMARLTGAGLLIVNGRSYAGDPERRGYRGVPVALAQGANDIFVFDIEGAFELEFWKPHARVVIGAWDVNWPTSRECGDLVCYPVFNASLAALDAFHLHYGHAVDPRSATPKLTDWQDGGRDALRALGMVDVGTYYSEMIEGESPGEADPAVVPVCVFTAEDVDADRQMLRRGPMLHEGATPDVSKRSAGTLDDTPYARSGYAARLVPGRATRTGEFDRAILAHFDQQRIWYRSRRVPQVFTGPDLGIDCVLYGNAETNPILARLLPPEFPIQVHQGALTVQGERYLGDDLGGWFHFRCAGGQRVVVIADTGERGAKLNLLLQPLTRPARGLDFCFRRASELGSGLERSIEGKLSPPPTVPR